jgi:hypothetical protein
MNVPEASSTKEVPYARRYDEVVALMEQALAILDEVGLTDPARHLDHAICLVPDAYGNLPRPRSVTTEFHDWDHPA